MACISNVLIVRSVFKFYQFKTRRTQEEFAASIGDVERSTVCKWLKEGTVKKLSHRNFDAFLDFVDNFFKDKSLLDEYCESFTEYFADAGISAPVLRRILLKSEGRPSDRFRELVCTEIKADDEPDGLWTDPFLMDQLAMGDVLNSLRHLCHPYYTYFTLLNQQLRMDNLKRLPLWLRDNYAIISIAESGYRFAVVLTNYEFSHKELYALCKEVKWFCNTNQIAQLLVFTDRAIDKELQHNFHEMCNCLIVPVSTKNVCQRFSRNPEDYFRAGVSGMDRAECYAAEIFQKLLGMFVFIKDEVVYHEFKASLEKGEFNNRANALQGGDLLSEMSDFILHNIHKYPYLTRHTIYFEKYQLWYGVNDWLQRHKRKKLRNVVELNFSGALLSSYIYDLCREIYLFDNSKTAIDTLDRYYQWSTNCPPNVSMHLADKHYDDINPTVARELQGKVDLIILGIGGGSNIRALRSFLRNIDRWLSPKGMLYISFINYDSVLFQRGGSNSRASGIAYSSIGREYLYALPNGISLPVPLQLTRYKDLPGILGSYFNKPEPKTYPFLSVAASTSITDRDILSEIRQQDKEYAGTGRHGHYITVLVEKTAKRRKSFHYNDPEVIEGQIRQLLDQHGLTLNVLFKNHGPATNNKQYSEIIRATGLSRMSREDYSILKLVLLRNRKDHSEYQFHIMDMYYRLNSDMMDYDRECYELVPESEIVARFGNGTLSPLLALPDIAKITGCSGNIFLYTRTFSQKQYVIMSSGSNTVSLSMKTAEFDQLFDGAVRI